jgi:hypothetical protein
MNFENKNINPEKPKVFALNVKKFFIIVTLPVSKSFAPTGKINSSLIG